MRVLRPVRVGTRSTWSSCFKITLPTDAADATHLYPQPHLTWLRAKVSKYCRPIRWCVTTVRSPEDPPGSRLKAAVPEVMVTKNGSSTCTTLWRLRMIGTISLLPFGNISNKNLKAINIPSTSTLIYPLASFMFFCESEVLMDRMMGNPKFAAWFQTKENERRKLSEVEICKIQLCKPTAGPLKQ